MRLFILLPAQEHEVHLLYLQLHTPVTWDNVSPVETVLHLTKTSSPSVVHPHSTTGGQGRCWRLFPHSHPAWNAALNRCYRSASWLEGRSRSSSLTECLNSSNLSPSILAQSYSPALLYQLITQGSITSMLFLTVSVLGQQLSPLNAAVISVNLLWFIQALNWAFFEWPKKALTESQPLKEWNAGMASATSPPSFLCAAVIDRTCACPEQQSRL